MAKMLPEHYSGDKTKAEFRIFEKLRDASANGADKWIVRHSLDVSRSSSDVANKKKSQSEIDF